MARDAFLPVLQTARYGWARRHLQCSKNLPPHVCAVICEKKRLDQVSKVHHVNIVLNWQM